MTENVEVTAIEVEEIVVEAPAPAVEAPKAAPTKSEAPAPGTPEFAAWAWENRNG